MSDGPLVAPLVAPGGVSGARPEEPVEDRAFRFTHGDLDCICLKDGYDIGPTRPLAPEAPTEELRSLLSAHGDNPDTRFITIACMHVT